jgi:Reverse transcriptase (RNA-dependent DNA polymerase)
MGFFHIKNPGADNQRFDVRLVAQGFSMKAAADYFDTCASVAKSTRRSILRSIAAALSMIVELIDIETTYLNAIFCKAVHSEQGALFEIRNRMLLPTKPLYALPHSEFEC